jgi:hypothetical protein
VGVDRGVKECTVLGFEGGVVVSDWGVEGPVVAIDVEDVLGDGGV